VDIYRHNANSKNRRIANWYFERKLLGYNYSSRLKDVVDMKQHCSGLEQLRGEIPNQKFMCVGVVKNIEQRRSRNNNKRYAIFNLSDEKHEVTCFIWEDTLKRLENSGKNLPAKDDLVSINCRTMQGGAVAAETVNIIDTKIFMKVGELKDA